MESDEALLDALATGDDGALRPLYERHAPVMLRLLRRLTSDASTAEEILQETWLAVWRSAATFRGDSSARGWLLGVARRQAHNRLRRKGATLVDLDEAAALADPNEDVEARILASADNAEIAAAIRQLPDHLRETLELVLVEDLTYREVADVVGIPVGTVKSRMAIVRSRLATALS